MESKPNKAKQLEKESKKRQELIDNMKKNSKCNFMYDTEIEAYNDAKEHAFRNNKQKGTLKKICQDDQVLQNQNNDYKITSVYGDEYFPTEIWQKGDQIVAIVKHHLGHIFAGDQKNQVREYKITPPHLHVYQVIQHEKGKFYDNDLNKYFVLEGEIDTETRPHYFWKKEGSQLLENIQLLKQVDLHFEYSNNKTLTYVDWLKVEDK